jgi:hypothetical protein
VLPEPNRCLYYYFDIVYNISMRKFEKNTSEKERNAIFLSATASNISLEGHKKTARKFYKRASLLTKSGSVNHQLSRSTH